MGLQCAERREPIIGAALSDLITIEDANIWGKLFLSFPADQKHAAGSRRNVSEKFLIKNSQKELQRIVGNFARLTKKHNTD